MKQFEILYRTKITPYFKHPQTVIVRANADTEQEAIGYLNECYGSEVDCVTEIHSSKCPADARPGMVW